MSPKVLLGLNPTRMAMTEAAPRFSIVIPAFNEEGRIGVCLGRLSQWLTSIEGPVEIIVVDDGSDSAGRRAAEEAVGSLPSEIAGQLIVHESNLGKGAAVRTGCLAARGVYVGFIDADLASPPADLGLLLSALDAGADMAVGVRDHGGGSDMRDNRRLTRRLAGRLFSLLARKLLALNIGDSQCPLKAFRRGSAQRLFRLQRIDTWSFDAELLYLAERLGLKVAKAPVGWQAMPGSHLKLNLKSAMEIRNLLRVRWDHRHVTSSTLASEAPEPA